MKMNQGFASPFHNPFGQDPNSLGDIWQDGNQKFDGTQDFQFGFGLPGMHHAMQVYLMPPDHEQSPWKVAGITMLLVTALLMGLTVVYYCVARCCCRKKAAVTEDVENADETPPSVNGEHRVSLPEDLPPIGASEKQMHAPASFLATPTLSVSQPYQPEPEDLARMQEIMLQRLEATPEEWEMEHGDLDRKQLF